MDKSQLQEFKEKGGVLDFKGIRHSGFKSFMLFGYWVVIIKPFRTNQGDK